ncbi:MAG: co-chaperone YbbN [Nocardioides sp.]
MTQPQFSRPGAIDLSGMAATAAGGPADARQRGQTAPAGSGAAYSQLVDELNFQSLLESSMKAPVLLVFFSPQQMPASVQLARDLETLAEEFEGRFFAGLIDADAVPAIASAMQIPSVPFVVMVLEGRPMPLLQDVVPLAELRAALTQILQQFTAQGITGRHQPRVNPPADSSEPVADQRYAAAQDALGEGDIDRAVAEYQKLVDANPVDTEAVAGLAMAQLLKRTQGVDLDVARAAAAAEPDSVSAQLMVADLDLLGGHVEDAFARLIETVRRTTGDERDQARQHLLGLFLAVGNSDPRVVRARQQLAAALF